MSSGRASTGSLTSFSQVGRKFPAPEGLVGAKALARGEPLRGRPRTRDVWTQKRWRTLARRGLGRSRFRYVPALEPAKFAGPPRCWRRPLPEDAEQRGWRRRCCGYAGGVPEVSGSTPTPATRMAWLAELTALLLVVALLSLALAASLPIAQRDYKRLLAYSSIEHMGLSPSARPPAPGSRSPPSSSTSCTRQGRRVLRLRAHPGRRGHGRDPRCPLAAGPPTGAGRHVRPRPARPLGLPPFSLFASELALARAAVATGLGWAVAAALLVLVVVFAAVTTHAARMLLGSPSGRLPSCPASIPATPWPRSSSACSPSPPSAPPSGHW